MVQSSREAVDNRLFWTSTEGQTVININVHMDDTRCWARVVRRSPPSVIDQFYSAQFLEHKATPILVRARRLKAAVAFSAILVAEHSHLPVAIPSESVRT